MIGGLASNSDIAIFLSRDEIGKLSRDSLKGMLFEISAHGRYGLELHIDDEKSGRKIRVESTDGTYIAYMDMRHYEELEKTGMTGTRYDSFCNQIGIFDESRVIYTSREMSSELDILKSKLAKATV